MPIFRRSKKPSPFNNFPQTPPWEPRTVYDFEPDSISLTSVFRLQVESDLPPIKHYSRDFEPWSTYKESWELSNREREIEKEVKTKVDTEETNIFTRIIKKLKMGIHRTASKIKLALKNWTTKVTHREVILMEK